MASNFGALQDKANLEWKELNDGKKAWIRIGTALCGKASGCDQIIETLHKELNSRELSVNVSEVGCMGLCFAEPLMDIKFPGRPRVFYKNVTPSDIPNIVDSHIINRVPLSSASLGAFDKEQFQDLPNLYEHPMMKKQIRIALRNAGIIDPNDINQYIANQGYSALEHVLTKLTPEQVLREVTKSGLRGRGGAAFLTGIKWGFLAKSPGPVKYILCNCEEGDPGAFNDKAILESDPHSLIEGMIIAGYATGASFGYVFVRSGHQGPIDRITNAIEDARKAGFLGSNILGAEFNFDIDVSLTGDSYVAGEETALMESIEGKRAMPRFRPPFPAQSGLFGKPSNINNVKTLTYIPQILLNGGDWFASIGTERSKGTAILCFSGDLTYTGMVEIPLGITLKEVILEMAGGVPLGKNLKLVQTGGPLGGFLDSDNLEIALDFDEMSQAGAILGSGGLIAAADDSCVVDLTRSLIAFCQFESCGKCFPCRNGMSHLLEILDRICRLEGNPKDLDVMRSIGKNMQFGSLCGHGQLGFNPVSSALRYFNDEFMMHLTERTCITGRCNEHRYYPEGTRR